MMVFQDLSLRAKRRSRVAIYLDSRRAIQHSGPVVMNEGGRVCWGAFRSPCCTLTYCTRLLSNRKTAETFTCSQCSRNFEVNHPARLILLGILIDWTRRWCQAPCQDFEEDAQSVDFQLKPGKVGCVFLFFMKRLLFHAVPNVRDYV